MLKIVDRPTFTATAVLNTRAYQGALSCDFVALRNSELRAIESTAREQGLSVQQAMLQKVLEDHADFEAYGELVKWNKADRAASVERLLDVPGLGPAILKAYYAGLWEEAAGNSGPSPAGS